MREDLIPGSVVRWSLEHPENPSAWQEAGRRAREGWMGRREVGCVNSLF